MDLALILSTSVSIITLITTSIVTIYQEYNQQKTTSMEMYFEAQLKAYMDFYQMTAELDFDLKEGEVRDARNLISAAKIAEMLSPQLVADCIEDFCAVYLDYIYETDNNGSASEKTIKEFKDSLFLINKLMRDELMRYDKPSRKYVKSIEKAGRKAIR
ncbi:MAG: hypothetical protein MR038_07605 [Oscillospiraceae bacterium]|nr:hypothetical protein [Oscillospiraceae bacterium]